MADIKVGDFVRKRGGNSSFKAEYKVLYIHNLDPDRIWYVVAYGGDIPTAHRAYEVEKVLPTKTFYLNGIKYQVNHVDGKPDWSSVKQCEQ